MRGLPAWARVAGVMFGVGWGANQFSSELLAYRLQRGVSESAADALFDVYALSLIPALLLIGPISDLRGRRAIVRGAGLLSAVASLALIAGERSLAMLFVGRFLAGVCSGAAFAAGTAWIKELSTPPYDSRAGEQAGARRAAIALSAGFGCGPLVAGLLAQWAPHPLVVAYVPHLVVMTIALLVLTGAPETVRPQAWSLSPRQLLRVPSAAHRRSHLQSWPLIVPAAGLLGCGLRAVPGVRPAGDSKTGHPGGPRSLTAIYYALTYVWFAAPIVLAELEKLASAPILLTLTGLLILVTMAAVRRASARQPAGSDPAWGP